MPFKQTLIYFVLFLAFISSCSRKQVPETANMGTSAGKANSAVKRTAVKRITAPKMIAVNDKVAKKSIDGRLYYDLEGHRYWKNYKDGKYYLFNRSMYADKDFNPGSN